MSASIFQAHLTSQWVHWVWFALELQNLEHDDQSSSHRYCQLWKMFELIEYVALIFPRVVISFINIAIPDLHLEFVGNTTWCHFRNLEKRNSKLPHSAIDRSVLALFDHIWYWRCDRWGVYHQFSTLLLAGWDKSDKHSGFCWIQSQLAAYQDRFNKWSLW